MRLIKVGDSHRGAGFADGGWGFSERPAKANVTFTKDVAPILLQSMRRVPSRGRDRADVTAELSGSASVGKVDSGSAWSSARCRPGPPTRITASSQTTRVSLKRRSTPSSPGSMRARRKATTKIMPPTPKFAEGWTIGKPDVVLAMQEEYSIPADGTVPYLYFTIPTGFQRRQVDSGDGDQARQSRRGPSRHCVCSGAGRGRRGGAAGEAQQGRGQLGGITPNKTGVVFAPGTARLDQGGLEHRFPDALHDKRRGDKRPNQHRAGLCQGAADQNAWSPATP